MPNDTVTLSAEGYQALLAEREALRDELRLAKAERDLAEERLRAYRQATLLRCVGGDISSNTLAASVVRVGLAAQPVINLMRDVLFESGLIYGDETTFQVLKEPGRRVQLKSYLWTQVNGSGPPVRLFSYSLGRGAQHAQRLYAGGKPVPYS